MATITRGKNFISGETVEPADMHQLVDNATIAGIVNADIDANAAIAASKLALTGAITDTQLATGAVTGAAGGGKIAASAITGQTQLTDPLASGDQFLVHDASASALRRVAWSALQPSGTVLQVLQSVNSSGASYAATIPGDDTIPQNTEGTEILSATITPSDASNKILVRAVVNCTTSSGDYYAIALFKDSDPNAIATAMEYGASYNNQLVLEYLHAPNTTSDVSYKIRAGAFAAELRLNRRSDNVRFYGGTVTSTLTLTEIKG